MADAGRPRIPTAVKERQGTLEKSRVSEREPVYPEGNQKAPANLTGPAAVEYRRLAKLLLAQGLFPATAEGELAFGCWWFGQWCEAAMQIERHGQIVSTEYGLKANPAVMIAAKAASNYYMMCGRFGLDPASAGKVVARPKGEGADELARKREQRRASR